MRRWASLFLFVVGGWVLVQDVRLVLGFWRGDFTRIVVDRVEHGIVIKAHTTQLPSNDDAVVLGLWAAFHILLGIFAWYWLSRRGHSPLPAA